MKKTELQNKINNWYDKLYKLSKEDEEILLALQDFKLINDKIVYNILDKEIKKLDILWTQL